jgi:hypothetical protein
MSKDTNDLDQEIIAVTGLAKSAENGLGINNFLAPPLNTSSPSSDPNNCFNRMVNKAISVVKWVIRDFKLRHLVNDKILDNFTWFDLIFVQDQLNLRFEV